LTFFSFSHYASVEGVEGILTINSLKMRKGVESPELEPILRLFNLQLKRQRCSRLERFFKAEEYIFVFKMH
jgi:hypothetical protein